MQARRSGIVTETAALVEYRRLCRHRDAQLARPRIGDTVQTVSESWLLARGQELQPNTVYNNRWLLSLIFPHIGRVRASRLSARMIERAASAGVCRRRRIPPIERAPASQDYVTVGSERPATDKHVASRRMPLLVQWLTGSRRCRSTAARRGHLHAGSCPCDGATRDRAR
jgi:hypothetical protein